MTSADLIQKAIVEHNRVLAQEKANGAYEETAETLAKIALANVITEGWVFVKDSNKTNQI